MTSELTILGIETSCDDTATAVVSCGEDLKPVIRSAVHHDQIELHADYGGVVPEVAARAHAERLEDCVTATLAQAGKNLSSLDAVAVTAGPGLIGGLLVGISFAKGLCAGSGLPLIGVNHLAGHALTARLSHELPFPYLALLASGGHCQFLAVRGVESFVRLGGTIDDAPGEAFDKCARILDLSQPGGPAIENEASSGNADRFAFPRPLRGRDGCDMSFSGLKTAVLHASNALKAENGMLEAKDRRNICAAFQSAVTDVFSEKLANAADAFEQVTGHQPKAVALCGGVAANQSIRLALDKVCSRFGSALIAPDPSLCTDNGAMIAWAGLERFRLGLVDDFSLKARPRWPLDSSSPPMLGHGKKGAKA